MSLSPYLAKWNLHRHRADLWLAWSQFRTCTPPSMMWSGTFLTPLATVCWRNFRLESWDLTCSNFTWRLLCSFILLSPWNTGFGGPVFCTRDKGDLCEYTTWSCTVIVQSFGQMLNMFCWHYCEMKVYVWLEFFIVYKLKYKWCWNCFALFCHLKMKIIRIILNRAS